MPRISSACAGGQNVCALLDAIAWSEIGPGLLAHSDDGYDVLVGSTARAPLLFTSYATHPNVYSRRFDSTAAGRYQELFRNWVHYQPLLRLTDFSPLAQDRIAIQQIEECGAIETIQRGQLAATLARIAHLWASLPHAGYGQHENAFAAIATAYCNAGGVMTDCMTQTGSGN